jgi:hypothetical protein
MHPTGRSLDAEFQPAAASTPLPPSDGTEMIIQDFNAFFERLSGLDEVRWSDEPQSAAPGHPPEPHRPAAHPIPAAAPHTAATAAPASAAGGASASRPAAAEVRAHPAPAAPRAAIAVPAPAALPAKRPGLPLGFKLAMTALLLFGVGMGAGWLALSLPKTTDPVHLTENPLVPFETPAPPVGAKAAAGAVPPASIPAVATPVTEPAASVAALPAAPAAAEQDGDENETDAFSQPESAHSQPVAPAPKPIAPALAAPPAPPAPAAAPAAKPATVAGAAAKPATSAPAAAGEGASRYAVQVGACSSARCVETYRKLIQPHVGAHPVQVVQQATAGAAVQRVRVEPLTKEQALALKQALEQADPRLKNAYVVRMAERS